MNLGLSLLISRDTMKFEDRYEAVNKLIPFLEAYRNESGVVLAIPRGGVPLGYEIAKQFSMPLELLMTKKIGHPMDAEFAIAAAGLEDHRVEYPGIVPGWYIDEQVRAISKSLRKRHAELTKGRPPVDVHNKVAIMVDDGIATGSTILTSVHIIRRQKPKKIIVATPVASPEAARKLKKQVDDFVCLYVPEDFISVGQYYADFSEVSDEDVVSMMRDLYASGASV